MTTAMTPENDVKRVLVEKEGLIGWLRIDNVRRLNAMSLAMWNDLLSGVSTLEADDGIRVIVVTGNGGKAFCTGGDISEFDRFRCGGESKNSYDAAGTEALNPGTEAHMRQAPVCSRLAIGDCASAPAVVFARLAA